MSMHRKLKTALDETRMLMMGSQILFGFQFEAVFQKNFEQLPSHAVALTTVGILLMAATVGVLIAPSAQHRLVEQGEASDRLLGMTTTSAGLALLLFSVSLGCDLAIVFSRPFGPAASWIVGPLMVVVALTAWFAVALAFRTGRRREESMKEKPLFERVDLPTKIEQMLTESRVILPGAQALLGFQLVVMLTPAFDDLPSVAKLAHAAALLCVTLTVILLMAPAAIHRLSFGGEDTPKILQLGSGLVTAALLPLSLGIAADIYVAVGRSLESDAWGLACALAILILLLAVWFGWPLLLRRRSAELRRN